MLKQMNSSKYGYSQSGPHTSLISDYTRASLAYQARTSVDAAALDNVGTNAKLSRPRLKQLQRV